MRYRKCSCGELVEERFTRCPSCDADVSARPITTGEKPSQRPEKDLEWPEYDREGNQFYLPRAFGEFEVAPLLYALDDVLPQGSVVSFVNPLGWHLKEFLKLKARKVNKHDWELEHEPSAADLKSLADLAQLHGNVEFPNFECRSYLKCLADLAQLHGLKELAVYFDIYAHDRLLVESEDGYNHLWLASSLPEPSKQTILRSVGLHNYDV